MFLSNSLKPLAVFCLAIAVLGACTPRPDAGDLGPSPTPVEVPEFPFSLAEPEVFQTEVVVTAGGVERRSFVARDHANYRMDYDLDSEDRRAVIRGEKSYLASYRERIYAEEPAGGGDVTGSEDQDAGLLLGQRLHADLVKTGDDGGLEKYEGRVEGDEDSRVAVWFDPAVKMIVREEMYGPGGSVVYSMELRTFKLEVPAGLFAPPKGFWQVTLEEFRKMVRR
jgi:hypothetical protein